MAAGLYSFRINQGETFDVRVDYTDSNGSPVDLTNWEARMQIRPVANSDTVYATLSSSLLSDGTGLNMTPVSASLTLPKSSGSIGIFISAQTSSLFTWTQGYYDLEIYSGSGEREYVTRLLQGKINVDLNVTR